jgi:hypothetical protein
LTGVPYILSITMTPALQKSQYISGTSSSLEVAKLRLSWLALAASRVRSSSSPRYFSNSFTTNFGLRRRPSAQSFSIRSAATFSKEMSCSMIRVMPGRKIFTAAWRPSGSTAK